MPPSAVSASPSDPAHTALAVLFVLVLLAVSLVILRPFLLALLWSSMIVVATWPVLVRLQARLGQRRWVAASLMTCILLLAFVLPLCFVVVTLASNAERLAGWAQSIRHARLPPPPAALDKLPGIGAAVGARWREAAAIGPEQLAQRLQPRARNAARWLVSQVGGLGLLALHMLLTVLLSAVLYARGELAAAGARHFCRRLFGARGDELLRVARDAIRGVAIGVVLTAIIAGVLSGIGLALAGVPFAGILTALIIALGIVQIGPNLPLYGCVAWLYWNGSAVSGTFLLGWTLVVQILGKIGRPILIQRVGKLPLLLVFAGVAGGMLAFGLVGVFVGPVVLAVTYHYLVSWTTNAVDGTKAQ